MSTRITGVCLLLLLGAAAVAAEERALPTFAYHVRGKVGNLWTSEIYLSNPGERTITVELADWVLSYTPPEHPCAAPFIGRHDVPPQGSIVWPAREISQGLGCVEPIVGGLVFRSDDVFALGSRLVNERTATGGDGGLLLRGVGQDVPGVAIAEPGAGERIYLLTTLVWHPNSCGPALFETYLNLTNFGDSPATLVLELTGENGMPTLMLNGHEVTLPAVVTVPARSFRQVLVGPAPSMLPVCLAPALFDLRLTVSGSLTVIGSVVDRASNDARTVVPVPVADGS